VPAQWDHQVSHPRLALAVSDGTTRFLANTVPQPVCTNRFILVLRASSESFRLFARPHVFVWTPSGVTTSLIATSTSGIVATELPRPVTFRPRRFSRPRRFDPPLALWVYFTPLPRPGFTQKRHPLSHSLGASSTLRALSSFDPSSLPAVAHQRRVLRPRPQGFVPCESPLHQTLGFSHRLSSVPFEFILLQVFALLAVKTPSRLLPLMTLVKRPSSRPLH